MIAPIPTMSPLSPAPNRQSSSRTQFTIDVDRRLSEENRLTIEANALAEWMSTVGLSIEQAYQAVELDTQAAEAAAILAGQHKDAAGLSAQAASESAATAGTKANDAEAARQAAVTARNQSVAAKEAAETAQGQSLGFRNEAQLFRDEAREIVIGDAIADSAISAYQVRSSMSASRGHFTAVPVSADAAVGPLDYAQITNDAAAITVTLPAAPSAGQLIMVGNFTDRRDHRVAVGDAPVKGRVAGGFVVLDKPLMTVTFKYVDADYGWEIV